MLSFRWLPCCLLLVFSSCTLAAKKVDLDYSVRLLPQSDQAEVSLRLAKGEMVRELELDLGAAGAYSDFKADGDWRLSGDHGLWKPSRGAATLSYRVRVSHRRESGAYDARMTTGWALLRGDDLVPAARLSQADGVELVSRLQFELPDGWNSVETGWPRIGKNRFRIDNPGRRFDRPTGWILAGKIGARRLRLGETDVTVYQHSYLWDHLPGALMVREIGGVVRTVDGAEYGPRETSGKLVVAADEGAYERVARLLR